jgi:hypothetical protein
MNFKNVLICFAFVVGSTFAGDFRLYQFINIDDIFGFFLQDWQAFYDPAGPIYRGISAGLFEGKDCYVGRGEFIIDSERSQLAPGSLLLESTETHRAGFYMEYGRAEHKITENVEYYAKEPGYDYKWVFASHGNNVTNAIQFKSGSETFSVGRITREDGSIMVGKVGQWKKIHYGRGFESTHYEVLTCEPIKDEPKSGKGSSSAVFASISLMIVSCLAVMSF